MELIERVEAFRRQARNWSEDLNLTIRGRSVPRYPNVDLRLTMRRKSGPTDLRYTKLNRDKDIRGLMRSKRRTSSVPPNPSTTNQELLTTDKAIDYLERTITNQESFLDTGIDERRQLISRLKRKLQFQARNKVAVKDESETSTSSDSNEEGEVKPSEDELTNVRFSESDTSARTLKQGTTDNEQVGHSKSGPPNKSKNDPKPGTSGTQKCGPPVTPRKSKHKKDISPIKFPGNSPIKNNEDVPLSKLIHRSIKPPAIMDARERLNAVPASSVPKIDSGRGPMESRINCEIPPRPNKPKVPAFLPWKPGHAPKNNPWLPSTLSHMKWGTAHSNRTFIEGKTTTRNDSTMTGQENEAPGSNYKSPFWWTREAGQTDAENEEGEEEEEEEEGGVNDPE
jgi:hypothetical protein